MLIDKDVPNSILDSTNVSKLGTQAHKTVTAIAKHEENRIKVRRGTSSEAGFVIKEDTRRERRSREQQLGSFRAFCSELVHNSLIG